MFHITNAQDFLIGGLFGITVTFFIIVGYTWIRDQK